MKVLKGFVFGIMFTLGVGVIKLYADDITEEVKLRQIANEKCKNAKHAIKQKEETL